jgi:hypothetical protein
MTVQASAFGTKSEVASGLHTLGKCNKMNRREKLEELISKEDLGIYREFDGQNCNDYLEDDQEPCQGWDGIERRCQCGNRRVNWVLSDDETYIYPEAY